MNSNRKIEFDLSEHQTKGETLEIARIVNIFALIPIIIIGLIGHSLLILVFIQKRFRKNSSNIFIICLALIDSFYLINHFFEDTLRTFINIYILNDETLFNKIILLINITDQTNLSCKIISYLKYSLRTISSYILVAITIQRLLVVFKPTNYITKNKAWLTIIIIIISSLILNIWILFIFELNTQFETFCNIKADYVNKYFQLESIFALVAILVPILIILTSNLLIMFKLKKAELERKKISNVRLITIQNSVIKHQSNVTKMKPFYTSVNNYANRTRNSIDDSKRSTKILFLFSILFIILNLPYLTVWSIIFYKNNQIDFQFSSVNNQGLFAALQICEIIYHLNFASLFFVYCASGSKFRNQLKYSSK